MTRGMLGLAGIHLVRGVRISALWAAMAGGAALAQATGEAQQQTQAGQSTTRPAGVTAQTQPAQTSGMEHRTSTGQQRAQAGRQREQAGQEQDIASRLRLVPEGWVAIGYDFDGDGEYDAVERIYAFDIDQARTRSQARREGGQPGWGGMAGGRPDGAGLLRRGRRFLQQGQDTWRREAGMGQGETYRLEGEITELDTVHLTGMRHPHLFGRVRDEDGQTARVDFGPRDLLGRLNLETGDHVRVIGTAGRHGEEPVLLAQRVEANNDMVTIDRPRGRGMMDRAGERTGERLRGEFLAFRRASFRGHPHDHLLARVRLSDGTVEVVDLGPVDELEHIRLDRGDRVELIVHRGRINGEPAYLAEQIRTEDGQIVQIDVAEGWSDRPRLRGTPVAPMRGGRFGEQGLGGRSQSATTRPTSEGEVAHTITIMARDHEFDPDEITVEPGQTVRVLLMNRGQEEYNIEFELPSGAAALAAPLQAGQAQILEFKAPEQEGTYTFFSPVGNQREQGMTGKLIVKSSE